MKNTILFFDGVCNLCNGFIDFIVRTDVNLALKVASLQGSTAIATLPEPLRVELQSVVLLQNGQTYLGSEAVLRTLELLPWPYRLLGVLRLLPLTLRDGIYFWVARHRYGFFGTRKTCRLPTPADQAHFADTRLD